MAIAIDKGKFLIGAVTTLELGGTDLGPTSEDGVTFTYTPTFYDHKSDQVAAKLRKTKTDVDLKITLNLMQGTLANLHKALNLAAASLSGSSLTIDTSQAADATLLIAGVAPDVNTRTIIMDAVQVSSPMAITMSKNNPVMIPVEFECLYSTTNSRFGLVGDA